MLTNLFPPLGGGAERQAERLAIFLARQNVFSGVITRKLDHSPLFENIDGVQIIRIREFGPGRFRSLLFIVGATFYMISRANSFDILHAHLAFAPAVAACLTGKLLGKRVVIKFGGSGNIGDAQELMSTWRGRLSLAIMRRWADLFVALTDEIESEMLGIGLPPARIVRMVNGVDTILFCPPVDKQVAKVSINMVGKTVLLFTGRLAAEKGLSALLLALKQVTNTRANVHLLLAGDGEEQKELVALAHDLDIESHLTFLGRCDSVQAYLKAADIFILPSLTEGISNSLLEAMASGLPCIASNVGGSVDALEHGECGVLISPNQSSQIADAILYLASNQMEMKRLGLRARQRAVEKYELAVVGEQYFRLYHKLVDSTL